MEILIVQVLYCESCALNLPHPKNRGNKSLILITEISNTFLSDQLYRVPVPVHTNNSLCDLYDSFSYFFSSHFIHFIAIPSWAKNTGRYVSK